MDIIIGIGEYGISNKKEDVLKTFALASCVGVTMYSEVDKVAGMIHIALPEQQTRNDKLSKIGYYASQGVPLLLHKMEKEFGCKQKDLEIQLFGGADSICKADNFLIGKKNILAITSLLAKMQLRYSFGGVGGNLSRTIVMDVATGSIKTHTQPLRI